MAIVQHSKDAKLISVIAKQISKEYTQLSSLLIEYMVANKLTGLRVSYVNEVLLEIATRVPGYDKFNAMVANPTDILYKMFRETLVVKSYDIDPAGSGDSARDEHIMFNLVGVPKLRSIYDIVYPRYQLKTTQDLYLEQESMLYDLGVEDAVSEHRNIEVVQAIKAQGVSVARSKLPPEVVSPEPVSQTELEVVTSAESAEISATADEVKQSMSDAAQPVKETVFPDVVSSVVSKQVSNNGTANTSVTNSSVVTKSQKKPV